MPYKIDKVTGEMSEYIFDFGGIVALRNFTARTSGERLIIQSATNANFTILDALVSEVEIDGVVYDTPQAAQEALQRLVFNPVVPVIMTLAERLLLQGALQKGSYTGTAQDLKNLIDGKSDISHTHSWENITDKPTLFSGSYNDLTDKPAPVDVSHLLPKGTYTGTAQDLENLIDGKSDILHTHAWDDITGKPTFFSGSYNDLTDKPTDLATETFVSEEIGKLKIGGRNLFKGKIHLSGNDYLNSDNSKEGVIKIQHADTGWNAYGWIIPTQEVVGKPLSMGIYFKAPMGVNFDIDFYADHSWNFKRKNFVGNGEWQWLKIENITKTDASKGILLGIHGNSPIITNIEYKDFILVIGTKAPENWSPAPEDIQNQFENIDKRNLLLSSSVRKENADYLIAEYQLSQNNQYINGEKYTLTIWGNLNSAKTNFWAYNSGGMVGLCELSEISEGIYRGTFRWKDRVEWNGNTYTFNNSTLQIYQMPNAVNAVSSIEKIKLEKGNFATDWSPAPEDIFAEITTRQLPISQSVTTSALINGFSQNGRTMVSTGTSQIVVTIDSPDGFSATYQKGGLGNISFVVGSGKTLVQVDGTNVISGAKGSTATISVVGNEILLRISNV